LGYLAAPEPFRRLWQLLQQQKPLLVPNVLEGQLFCGLFLGLDEQAEMVFFAQDITFLECLKLNL
jgi:hypothetical protein